MIVVQCHGTFDFLHYGHLVHFQTARTYGDVLIVTVTADSYVKKGVGRPHFLEHQRVAMIRALACVDDVRLIHAPDAETAIRQVRPHIYCKGREYEGRLPEKKFVESLGGKVVFTHHDEGSQIHSTKTLAKFKNDKAPAGPD